MANVNRDKLDNSEIGASVGVFRRSLLEEAMALNEVLFRVEVDIREAGSTWSHVELNRRLANVLLRAARITEFLKIQAEVGKVVEEHQNNWQEFEDFLHRRVKEK